MKILHIVPSYKPAFVYGGPIYSVSTLCEAQVKLGNEVFVFTTNANGSNNLDVPLESILSIDDVQVTYFPRITGDHSHVSPKLWKALLKESNEYDVIHLHSWWSILMMGCAWILAFNKITFILSPRGMFSNYSFSGKKGEFKKLFFFNWLSKPFLKNQIFHATANSEELEIKGLFGSHTKVFTLPNLLKFPSLSTEKIERNNSSENLKLIFISRIDKKKGIEILLNSIPLLVESGISLTLTILGSGEIQYENELRSVVTSLGIEKNIIWKGTVDWTEKFNDILSSNILILPSYNENFANIILETLYAGRPVILTKYVGLSDYVKANEMGWVIDTNSNDIVKSVNDYILNKGIWKNKALSMNAQIRKDFDSKYLGEEYIKAYRNLLKFD